MSLFGPKRGRPKQSIADLAAILEEMQLNMQKQPVQQQSNVKGFLDYIATSAKIDGSLSGGDIIVTAMAVAVMSGLGGVAGVAQAIKFGNTEVIKYFWADATYIATVVASIRIGADLINVVGIARMISEWLDQWAEGKLAEAKVRAMQDELMLDEPEPVGRPAIDILRKGPDTAESVSQRILLPNERTISQVKMISVLKKAIANSDVTEGKSWSREYWCNRPDDPERPGLDYISKRQWKGIKMWCEHFGIWRAKSERKSEMTDLIFDHLESVPVN